MRVLILGAGGQVGRALAATTPKGVELILLDRQACDVSDSAQFEDALARSKPTVVMNAAAYTQVDRAESEPEQAARVNATAPGMVARAAQRASAKTVHFSTDFVFDGLAGRPYRPDDAPRPLSVYGRTKLEGERAVAAAAPDALIIRTAWVYAARGTNFVNTMLRVMRERERVRVVSDQVGSPTHAASLARAAWALVAAGAGGIQHFTDAGIASWYDFAVAIAEEAEASGALERLPEVEPISTADYPTAAQRPAYGVLDKQATWQSIGYIPAHWRVELRTMLRELKEIG